MFLEKRERDAMQHVKQNYLLEDQIFYRIKIASSKLAHNKQNYLWQIVFQFC